MSGRHGTLAPASRPGHADGEVANEVCSMSGCEEVREFLVASARGEMITPASQALLGGHLECCPPCRLLMANQRMLSAGLSAMAAAPAGVPSVAVKAALMQEFRRSRKVTPIR